MPRRAAKVGATLVSFIPFVKGFYVNKSGNLSLWVLNPNGVYAKKKASQTY